MLVSTKSIKTTHSELQCINILQKKKSLHHLRSPSNYMHIFKKKFIKLCMQVKYCNPQKIVLIPSEILYWEKQGTQIRTSQLVKSKILNNKQQKSSDNQYNIAKLYKQRLLYKIKHKEFCTRWNFTYSCTSQHRKHGSPLHTIWFHWKIDKIKRSFIFLILSIFMCVEKGKYQGTYFAIMDD